MKKTFLAVDLGAGSGRMIAVDFDGRKMELEEISRWQNAPIRCGSSLHWDMESILKNLKRALSKAVSLKGKGIVSMGIDTWGVDYGLLDANAKLISNPFAYRDERTQGAMERVFSKIPKSEIYRRTGIQFMPFNTIFQLACEGELIRAKNGAKTFLMMPDLIAHALTGRISNERTNASTTQLYDPVHKDWIWDFLGALDINSELFSAGFIDAGDPIGPICKGSFSDFSSIKLVCVASHDTASAVVAVPSTQECPAYINSGTWSLPGLELPSPIISDVSFRENFTNEVGAENRVRFLKNVTGMWLVQKCLQAWQNRGRTVGYDELENGARACKPFNFIFDPDLPAFANPENMPLAISQNSLSRCGRAPEGECETFRAIQESIALKYAYVFEKLSEISGRKIVRINIMGGGSKAKMLNQFTADATGMEVSAGPVEATAIGNAVMQMKASGDISTLEEGRSIVSSSFSPQLFQPNAHHAAQWAEMSELFRQKFLKNSA